MGYQSEFTNFIDTLKREKPDLEARQLQGRAIFWDRSVDPDTVAGWKQARVPQKPYVYAPE